MSFIRKLIINIGDLLGENFPRIFIKKSFNKKAKLTIYNLHSTSEIFFPEYLNLLKKIETNAKFINPKLLKKFFNNQYGDRSYSLLTLDDGFNNNYKFAEEVLEKLDIKAIFFIIPKFISKKEENLNSQFFEALYPNEKLISARKIKNNFSPLTVNQIIKLTKKGHTIGMHGFNHENFAKINESQIKISIREGINIFKRYKIKINHFAYPFGDKKSFTKKSDKILKNYFDYIHLGIRGDNYIDKNNKVPKFLKRHPISTHGKDLNYFPLEYKEVKFFTLNRLNKLILFLKKIFK